MAQPFFDRLRSYYAEVGKVLRGEAAAASTFPNTTDIGSSRERIYAEFLRQHAPSKCNVLFGGFLFGSDGTESKQMDVMVTADTCPQFNFLNKHDNGKTFTCVDGTLACASVKSSLTKEQLFDSLGNLASIPASASIKGRTPPNLRIKNYDEWPYKIIFASDGLAADTILGHLGNYYAEKPTIPLNRRPNIIHVAGKYFIHRISGEETLDGRSLPIGQFVIVGGSPETQAIAWTLREIQSRASASSYITFNYDFIVSNLHPSDSA